MQKKGEWLWHIRIEKQSDGQMYKSIKTQSHIPELYTSLSPLIFYFYTISVVYKLQIAKIVKKGKMFWILNEPSNDGAPLVAAALALSPSADLFRDDIADKSSRVCRNIQTSH